MSHRDYLEELGAKSGTRLDDLAHRRRLLIPAFLFGLGATGIVWLLALSFPRAASNVFSVGLDSNVPRYGTLLSVLVMSLPFAPPFILAFALGNILLPANEEPENPSGVMAGFNYAQKSNQRRYIVVVAGMCGALNCLLLLIALSAVTGH
jgi:hypothetical protein